MEEEVALPMPEKSGESHSKGSEENRQFICGVIEGFYGRPWTTEQRKDLFRKLKKWGMESYVYAPKDDYKHRAYWRELYTVEEADHLSSLISAAKDHNVTFYYALSPGLDMTYSSQKETHALKRKLDQVSQFGCVAFALLFDDIESELSKADKEVFQTFANAQVSVTNEIYTHLGNPKFLFCPTQYCSTRAVPSIHDSEYLNTLGSKLNQGIEIMWTGNKVISKTITLESIQEITEVLRRPPVIWDNLHANDYDQKRVFLGPYCGRSPELIPHLRGVMTNPNCEFHANTIAIHTLAYWSQCSLDSKVNSSLSADIKLETENDDGIITEELPTDCCISKNMYHPRIALKNAIAEWLPEFFLEKEAWGPITKPQPQVTMVMPIIPIIPSINTCMTLTTTTTTSTNSKTILVPEVTTTQLQALAEVCSTVNSSAMTPISNPVMNSLVSPTKVVTNEDILNPITTNATSHIELPKKIPISIVPVAIMQSKVVEAADVSEVSEPNKVLTDDSNKFSKILADGSVLGTLIPQTDNNGRDSDAVLSKESTPCLVQDGGMNSLEEDIAIEEKLNDIDNARLSTEAINMLEENNLSPLSTGNEPMECSSSLTSQTSPKGERKTVSEDVVMAETASVNELNNSMQVESSEPSPLSNTDMKVEDEDENHKNSNDSTKINAEDLHLLCDLFYLPFEHGSRGTKFLHEFNWLKANASVLSGEVKKNAGTLAPKPEVAEWLQRAHGFSELCDTVQSLLRKVANCANKEICHDLFSYVWDIAGALTLLDAFVKWLSAGRFPHNVFTFTQGSYTWFSKGWKDAFMSGDQEPWVFRGGLTADLQRLMPVDAGNDLFFYKLPDLPSSDYFVLRPYVPDDESKIGEVCTRAYLQLLGGAESDACPAQSDQLRDLIADSIVGPFATLNPELCIVGHNGANEIVGYVAVAMDITTFARNIEVCWVPAMCEKYPKSLLSSVDQFTTSKRLNECFAALINEFHDYKYQCPAEVSSGYPAVVTIAVLEKALARDQGIAKRLLIVALATLRANGCFGVHARVSAAAEHTEQVQYYSKLGFTEVFRDANARHVYMGRRF